MPVTADVGIFRERIHRVKHVRENGEKNWQALKALFTSLLVAAAEVPGVAPPGGTAESPTRNSGYYGDEPVLRLPDGFLESIGGCRRFENANQ